jgi:hypothetical protein
MLVKGREPAGREGAKEAILGASLCHACFHRLLLVQQLVSELCNLHLTSATDATPTNVDEDEEALVESEDEE